MTTDEAKKALVARRLVLCKQLYLNGFNSSMKPDALSKMIAVHNMHNAIELFLRSLFLFFEVRAEKTLNIEFDAMLSELETWLKANHKKTLPFRQELRNLNQQRNHVQHHAIEPELSTMEYWRVYTRQFFEKAFRTYYDVDFSTFSVVDLISDSIIRNILNRAETELTGKNFELSAIYCKYAFHVASRCLDDVTPSAGFSSPSFLSTDFNDLREMRSLIEKLSERIEIAQRYSAILSTGIGVSDYKKYLSSTIHVRVLYDGRPFFEKGQYVDYTQELAEWILSKTVEWILQWQNEGLKVSIHDRQLENAKDISENGLNLSK